MSKDVGHTFFWTSQIFYNLINIRIVIFFQVACRTELLTVDKLHDAVENIHEMDNITSRFKIVVVFENFEL